MTDKDKPEDPAAEKPIELSNVDLEEESQVLGSLDHNAGTCGCAYWG